MRRISWFKIILELLAALSPRVYFLKKPKVQKKTSSPIRSYYRAKPKSLMLIVWLLMIKRLDRWMSKLMNILNPVVTIPASMKQY